MQPVSLRYFVGRTYPWQVAPQQSLFPFWFNIVNFKFENYIYKLSKNSAIYRLDKALPILNNIGKYIANHNKQVLPKSPIGKAFEYCIHRWDNLMNYLMDGNLEIDNNGIENAIVG